MKKKMKKKKRIARQARAMWKAELRFGDGGVPVKLYAAVQERRVRFHLLHDADRERLHQRFVHPRTGEEVPAAELLHGYPGSPGPFVVLRERELAALEPEP
jgi:DNA end-binding protein Ku